MLLKDGILENSTDGCFILVNNLKKNIKDVKCRDIYDSLKRTKVDCSKANVRYSEEFRIDKDEWQMIYGLLHTMKITNKTKENSFKILHNYVATNDLLNKIGVLSSPRCNFCNLYKQNTKHLFFECITVRNFWFSIAEWLRIEHDIDVNLKLRDVLFGYNVHEGNNLVNQCIANAKLYIFNCKHNDKRLDLETFHAFATSY